MNRALQFGVQGRSDAKGNLLRYSFNPDTMTAIPAEGGSGAQPLATVLGGASNVEVYPFGEWGCHTTLRGTADQIGTCLAAIARSQLVPA